MISVCIATYNGEKYIHRQLETILSQLTAEDEIIISDDNSTDNTLDIIKSFGSPNIHIYINNGDHGYTPNFENALKHAKGEYIFISDQDDIWAQNKVQTCMKHLKKYSLVIHDADIIDEKEDYLADSFYQQRKSKSGLINNIIRYSFLGCCTALRREVLIKALPFLPNHKMCTHDNWLFVVAGTFFNTIMIDDKLIHYRRHKGNVSTGGFTATTTIGFKIRYRLYLLKWLTIKAFK